MTDATDLTKKYTIPNYSRYDFWPVRGQGVYLWDRDGRKYVDFAGGVAVNPLGHCHPEVVRALQQQAETLIHVSNWFQIPQQGELAQLLVEEVLGIAGKCFFGNSGAEANEGLIKMARRYGVLKPKADGSPRYEILTFTGSFHGRTFATMTATAQEKVHGGFGPLVPGFTYVPFNDVEALKAAVNENTVGILLEPVQGESGVNPVSAELLRTAAALRDEHDLVLLFDEIQCGLGRAGQMGGWRCVVAGDEIKPDGVSFAKSIGSGYALGAFWVRDRSIGDAAETSLSDILNVGSHGSTYGGSPLACAVALATLRVILRENLADHAQKMGNRVAELALGWGLAVLPKVRAFGCMIGFELEPSLIEGREDFKASGLPASLWVTKLCIEAGLIVVPAGPKVIRWLAPMNITEEEADEALKIFRSVLERF